jgi:hypothetical protein
MVVCVDEESCKSLARTKFFTFEKHEDCWTSKLAGVVSLISAGTNPKDAEVSLGEKYCSRGVDMYSFMR